MRTLLICHADDPMNREGLARWLASFSDLAGVVEIREAPQRLWKRVRREVRRVGLLRFADVFAFRLYYKLFLAKGDHRWERERLAELCDAYPALTPATRILTTHSPNSPEAEDWLRYHPAVRGLLGRYKWWRDSARRPHDHQARPRSVRDLCAAARLVGDPAALRKIHSRILQRVAELDPRQVNWSEFVVNIEQRWMPRGVILKPWVSPREPGGFYSAFEVEWFKILRHCDLHEFARRCTLVIAPSSSPYNLVNYVFAAAYPAPFFSQISNRRDLDVLPRLSPNLRALPLYASHWVDPRLFHPLPRTARDVNLVMVASFGKVKRHHALFLALRKMPAGVRVLLVGQDQDGRTAETIEREARYYGVAGRLSIRANATYPEVAEALCRGRVSLILSRREGSCVAISESLFADTPAALLASAEIGSRAFINEHTGRFLDENNLAAQLTDFLDHAEGHAPRQWAEQNISCFRSTARLNEILRGHALAAGHEGTRDLAPLCWRPDPRLADPEDELRMADERRFLRDRFGLIIPPDRP
jgi:hypothetical protein